MKKKQEVIIIGGGAIGAAAFHFLAKKGMTDSLLIERRKGFGMGATGAWGSLLRLFSIKPFYTERALMAFRYYQSQFEGETSRPLEFGKCGSLYFVTKEHFAIVEKAMSLIQASGLYPAELLDATRGRERFPEFQWFDDDFAVYEPEAGFACPHSTTEAWIDSGKRKGAKAKTDLKVVEILAQNKKVQGVRCSDGNEYLCDRLVLCAGPWTNELLEPLGFQIPLILKAIQVNQFHYQKSYSQENLPFFVDLKEETFGRPALKGSYFLGGYLTNEKALVSQFRQPLGLEHAMLAKQKISKRLKWIRTASLSGGVRAIEGYTLDDTPILGYSKPYENLLIACGWGCTGFALAPAFGNEIAKLLYSEKPLTEESLCQMIA